jgi:hypothetical protein
MTPPDTLRSFAPRPGSTGSFHDLSVLEQAGLGRVSRLPVSPSEIDYYRNGGILPYMLRELVAG